MKINIIKIFFISTCFFLLLFEIKAQSFNSNVANEKYWYYRNRLYYFVKPGLEQGESNVGSIRNQWQMPFMSFGDQPSDLSYYIGVLATEYKLLTDNHNVNGTDNSVAINNTLVELYYAFEAFKRMDECEKDYPWEKSQTAYDGLFARDVVIDPDPNGANEPLFIDEPGNMEYFNKGLSPNQSYPDGHPAYIDSLTADYGKKTNMMSQDLAYYSLIGFSLTAKCLPDHDLTFIDYSTGTQYSCNFEEYAQEISLKILQHVYGNSWPHWLIRDPNGNLVQRGEVAYGYAYGFSKAVYYIVHSTNNWSYLQDVQAILSGSCIQYTTWNGMQYVPISWFGDDYNDAMTSTLAAISDSWRVPATPINSTFFGLNNIAGIHNWETFYTLLWKFLHDKDRTLNTNKIEVHLAHAPCGGPFSYYKENDPNSYCAEGGWGAVVRWRCGSDVQNYGDKDIRGNYTGLDYMLLYNLYRLVEQPVGYVNLIDRYVNANFPFHFSNNIINYTYGNDQYAAYIQAFNSIVSVSKIVNEQNSYGLGNGNVTYRAGERIVLKPGFKAEEGTKFHAYIDPLECNGGQYRNSAYSDYPMSTIYDSLLCAAYYTESNNFVMNNTYEDEDFNNELKEKQIILFPNPNNGIFSIQSTKPIFGKTQIQIINSLGLCIYEKEVNDLTKADIDISFVSDGSYLLYLITENTTFTDKIIISH
jgi:hypothetical protein